MKKIATTVLIAWTSSQVCAWADEVTDKQVNSRKADDGNRFRLFVIHGNFGKEFADQHKVVLEMSVLNDTPFTFQQGGLAAKGIITKAKKGHVHFKGTVSISPMAVAAQHENVRERLWITTVANLRAEQFSVAALDNVPWHIAHDAFGRIAEQPYNQGARRGELRKEVAQALSESETRRLFGAH